MHPDGYLAPLARSLAWHGVANGDSQQELEFLFGDKDLHTACLASREVEKPVGLLPGTVISPISAFSLLLPSFPPTAPADRGFYGISSGCSCHSFYSWSVKVEKVIYDISRGQWCLDICRAAHHQISTYHERHKMLCPLICS